MTQRLLLTVAIGLVLGTAAFAQTAAVPAKTDTAAKAAPPSEVIGPARLRIAESVARMTVKPLRGVDFQVSVGSRVPRELRVYRLPADVVQIVPQYRDHRFLVVEKDIVIVEPSTNKIVAVLPRDPAITTATSEDPAPAPAATALTPAATPAPTAPAPTAAAASTTPAASAAPAAPPAATASTTATSTTTATSATTATTSPTTAAAPATSSTTAAPEQPAIPTSQASAEPDRPKASEPERPKAKKSASRSQKAKRATRDDARRARAELRVGQRLPDDVPLYALPPRYYRELPAREYRYPPRYYRAAPPGRIYYEYD